MASRDTAPPADQAAPSYDYHNAATVSDLFERAAEANLRSTLRRGATAHLPDRGRLIMTGDLHDHAVNLQRILNFARLERHPERHLVLHEIVHGRNRVNGRDFSVRTLARVAALKVQFPEQVHLLQANHELAQLGGEGILKEGVSVVECFDEGVDYIYRDDAARVRNSMLRFIRSLLLAIKCPNGIFCSHSLPAPRKLATFDETVIDRVPTDEDLTIGGSAYDLVWGRNHTRVVAEELGDAWGVKLFVMGHQPAEMGHEVEGDSMLILASDHERGVALPIDLDKTYDLPGLVEKLVPLATVKL